MKVEDQYETRWRCWRCKTVCKMGHICVKCNKYLQDYPHDDFEALLVHVKVAKEANFDVKEAKKNRFEHTVSALNFSLTGVRCKKCHEPLYTNSSEYCHRCRPKCEECNVLFVY